jgi:hypothetical protein
MKLPTRTNPMRPSTTRRRIYPGVTLELFHLGRWLDGDRYAARSPPSGTAKPSVSRGQPAASTTARFSYQHYGSSAGSRLAESFVRYRVMWPWLGIESIDKSSLKPWVLTNLDRAHFYVPAAYAMLLPSLEIYIRARVGTFDGAA